MPGEKILQKWGDLTCKKHTEQNEHIVALVSVGSGSYGFIDELSDLDMVVAIDSDENMETVMGYVHSKLNERLNFLYFKQVPQRRLQVYLADNYLGIRQVERPFHNNCKKWSRIRCTPARKHRAKNRLMGYMPELDGKPG